MSQQVSYEVQFQRGGRWSIHARFNGFQKDAAIEEGKELDQLPNIESVKVVKEVYDDEKGTHAEFIVYKSAAMKSNVTEEVSKISSTVAKGRGSPRETWLRDHDDGGVDVAPTARGRRGRKKKKKASSLTSILVKLLMVVMMSVILAALVAVTASEILHGANVFGVRIVGNAESNLLIGAFIITFLVSATGMAITVMRGEDLEASRNRRILARQEKLKKQAQARAKKAAEESKQKKSAIPSAVAGPTESAGKPADTLTQLEDAMKGVGAAKTDDKAPAQPEKKPDEPSMARGATLDAATYAKAPPKEEPLSPQAEKQKAFVMNFLGKALEGQPEDKKKLDNFNKFGVNLFLAGACEVMAQKRDLGVLDRSRILSDAVQVMGFKKSHAMSFADRYEEYLMADSRYMQMFQAGRNAMNIYSADETAGPKLLTNALDEWNKPKQKEEQAGPVTVLFTDIAGSTAMTQNLGDAGAQQVVRAHNRIVREALSACAGKEIKHTGDGIMASFGKTSDGVDAAIQMQRETMIHNQNNPDLPLHLKIGLNAGEPIAEDNDLFGTTVQLSARIVDKASADEIFVSEIVRGICAGKDYTFVNRGGYPMKGFGDDVTLYEVVWAEGAAAEGGDAAVAEGTGEQRNFTPTPVEAPAAAASPPETTS